MEKRRNCFSPLFHNIFCLLLDVHVSAGTIFPLRDKRLFEISEFEITRVNCMPKIKSENNNIGICKGFYFCMFFYFIFLLSFLFFFFFFFFFFQNDLLMTSAVIICTGYTIFANSLQIL